MATDTYDLTFITCPKLLAELGWRLETGDDEWWKRCEDGTHYPREIYTLSEATASDRREAIGLLVERLGEQCAWVEPIGNGSYAGHRFLPDKPNLIANFKAFTDPLYALHAAYVAEKGQ